MADQRAILVLGPESSGTRLVTRILIESGCHGDDGHVQPWDDREFNEEPLLVWRRSFPYGKTRGWDGEIESLIAAQYSVQAVVVVREFHSNAHSQVRWQHAETMQAAVMAVNEALCLVFGALAATGIPCIVVTYEGLVQRPDQTQKLLAEWLKLPKSATVKITDGNEQYYET